MIENPLIPIDRLSSFYLYKRITAWVFRFLHNCKANIRKTQLKAGPLTLEELNVSANYWYAVIQGTHFPNELRILSKDSLEIHRSSKIYSLNPLIDDHGILQVGGRQQRAKFSCNSQHPIILDSRHPLTKLLIRSEHIRLLHGGSLLISSSLFRNFHLLGGRRAICCIVRNCVTCRRRSPKTSTQMMGLLPPERIIPDMVLEHV